MFWLSCVHNLHSYGERVRKYVHGVVFFVVSTTSPGLCQTINHIHTITNKSFLLTSIHGYMSGPLEEFLLIAISIYYMLIWKGHQGGCTLLTLTQYIKVNMVHEQLVYSSSREVHFAFPYVPHGCRKGCDWDDFVHHTLWERWFYVARFVCIGHSLCKV